MSVRLDIPISSNVSVHGQRVRTGGGWPTSPTAELFGFGYTAFLVNVYSRRILGRRVMTSKMTPLATRVLE